MPVTLTGTVGDDYLTATTNDVYHLNGQAGNDRLVGGTGTNYLSGGIGNDLLQAGTGKNFMLGGVSPNIAALSGKDTFVVSLKALQAGAEVTIYDFGGAGGYNALDNDFLALTGFSAGSSITSVVDSTAAPDLAYYTIHDAASAADYLIAIRSTNGNHLGAGDFNFYS